MIDQPDQARALGDRNDIGRQQRLPVRLLHPHQALVERRLPRARFDHRLERRDDAALVQRGDDLVGDADVHPALGIARDIRTPQRERPGAAALGGIERFLSAVDRLIGIAGETRDADRADRGRHRDGAGFGRHHLVADRCQETLGRDIGVVDRAVPQDQPELVAGESAEHVTAAQPGADAFSDFGDHGVRDVEAEGVVDARQMIDADQHEGAGRPETRGLFDRFRQRGDEMRAIELTGQWIVPRQPHELFVAGMALVIDTDDALRAHRLAVGSGKPAAGLLDPDHGRGGRGPHAIFDPVGDVFAAPRRRRLSERLVADRTGRLDQPGEAGAAGQRLRRNIGEDRAGVSLQAIVSAVRSQRKAAWPSEARMPEACGTGSIRTPRFGTPPGDSRRLRIVAVSNTRVGQVHK